MRRRAFLQGAAVGAAAIGARSPSAANAAKDDWPPRPRSRLAAARENFPYDVVEVPGRDAFAEWTRLSRADGIAPVVVGGADHFAKILEPFHPDQRAPDLAETLAKADALTRLEASHSLESERSAALRRLLRARPNAGDAPPPPTHDHYAPELVIGDWPRGRPHKIALTVVEHARSRRAVETAYIVLAPTDDPTTIPAHLRWGGWHDCPPAEHHVAALRSWRDRYGAMLVGMGDRVLNTRTTRRPTSRDDALALAYEHYDYCDDIVHQGHLTLSKLAARLNAHAWWHFWWD